MGVTTDQKKCKLCRNGPRELPDRETGSSRKSICKKCQQERLLSDFRIVVASNLAPRAGR